MLNPEINPIQLAHEPAAADAIADTAAWCDLSKAKGVLITVLHYRGGDTDLVLHVREGRRQAAQLRSPPPSRYGTHPTPSRTRPW